MNSMDTALTRPRMVSGVDSWIRLPRTFTLTMSEAPSTNSASSDSGNQVDRPNTMVATPKIATAANILPPTRVLSGRWVRKKAIEKAPTAGALRRKPRPMGPTCRMSRA